ncbi:bifunctional serine/threonine-protein kinase/formylglycine-generating enzyme family protein [Roseofilum sp. BLCC_M154]|uniref:Bifunctional serine/threonine-protein kinase/formylglycine-generating enzyme family protein n=1 Tax=Roseofilum acuticapitatum BLCC-M154 TaxID=3022444 RepID=A0ABT7ATU7_9CYAN|nr:bifunctional serine/threonine-protein kinase/formylglycine-generating enzyme family protein [Roseofilum acuticapitatum]MDJ1169864.1 bifunctional serine/threonine-protein kinase/formylglycine-generating enzyme family protein [Roseofilum acuticapitatum BLCC-M154]
MRCLNCHTDGLPLNTEICPNCGVHLPSLHRNLLKPGTKLQGGKYEIDYGLGQGGFGITYRGSHSRLQKIVAIKEYFPQEQVVRHGATGKITVPRTQEKEFQRGKERFFAEGQKLAQINHPNVVRVEDSFEEGDTGYLVMELIPGNSLKQILEQKRLSTDEIEGVMAQVVAGLAAVHKQKMYHLDLKPDNLMMTSDGVVKLIDFGAAKQVLATVTRKSTRLFTEGYTAPEVMGDGEIGAFSDIFELGMILHEMVAGELPPSAISRLLVNKGWQPQDIGEPWLGLLKSALPMEPTERAQDVRQWWESGIAKPLSLRAERSKRPDSETGGDGFIPLRSTRHDESIPLRSTRHDEHQVFRFEVLTVNRRGKVIKRENREAQYFQEDLGEGISLDMVAIPGGTFLMGSPPGEGRDSEKPQHSVTMQPFYMGKFLITQAQWRRVASFRKVKRDLESNPSRFKGDNLPVEEVSWYDCEEFCARLSQYTRKSYGLPSEAQWEYGCRAGTTTPFHFGETLTTDLANYAGNYTYADAPKGEYRQKTTPVGKFPPNGFGLYDMHGNLGEWCYDHWHEDYYNAAPVDGSIWLSRDKEMVRRVIRGGSWDSSPRFCRCAFRFNFDPDIQGSGSFGLRVVRLPPRT